MWSYILNETGQRLSVCFSSRVQGLRFRCRANQEVDSARVMVLYNAFHQGKENKCVESMSKRVIIMRTLQPKSSREGSEVMESMEERAFEENRIATVGILEKLGEGSQGAGDLKL